MIHKAKAHVTLLCALGAFLLLQCVFPSEQSSSAHIGIVKVDPSSHRWSCLRRYHLIELDEDAIWILDEGGVKRASLRFRPDMWGRGEFHPFALQLVADRVQSLDPDPKVRDADLVDLNARAGRRRAQRGDQGDHRRVFAHAVGCSALRTVAQHRHPIPTVLLLRDPVLIPGGPLFAVPLGYLKPEQVTGEAPGAARTPPTARAVSKT